MTSQPPELSDERYFLLTLALLAMTYFTLGYLTDEHLFLEHGEIVLVVLVACSIMYYVFEYA